MNNTIKEIIWNQFGASIDMLLNAISNCPDDYFITNKRFYYIAFHSTIFLDYYLTIPPKDFSPLLSFTQKEPEERPKEAIDDLIPDKIYSKQEIVEYLKQSREKCRQLIYALTDETLNERFKEGDDPSDMDYPILEILLYNLRHTQHHTAQLNMLLQQDLEKHMAWSFRAGDLNQAY
ncbi:DinB family protein [Cytophagaceae bacterium YF14B1]|uniref:DinB family protein n=1 Tax=Xanthocytophaga flava TaxID=3048013 RepID=A0AAE3QMB8_9BACT|nr:DinB family protein [Xanthocytophaga flavus]MDJ1479998.1 DinB family protein [Xanthocytophaga flavus]